MKDYLYYLFDEKMNIDLLLIHQAYGDVFGTWRAMEKAYRAGKSKCATLRERILARPSR